MAGPYHYIVRLDWTEGHWQAPPGFSIGLDLRSVPDQALSETYGDWPWCYALSDSYIKPLDDQYYIGEGHVRECSISSQSVRDALATFTGVAPTAQTPTMLTYLLFISGEASAPDGNTPLKPILPTSDGECELWLPFHSLVYCRPFGTWNPGGNPYHSRVRDLLRLDLETCDSDAKEDARRLREQAAELRKDGRKKDANRKDQQATFAKAHASRVLDGLCRKYECDAGEFSTVIRRGHVGTSYADDFNRADSSTVTGWTEVSGNWEIKSNQLRREGSGNCTIRYDTAVGSADHLTYCTWVAEGPYEINYRSGGPTWRFSASAETCYYARYYPNGGPKLYLCKIVAGEMTTITTDSSLGSSGYGKIVKGKGNGSTQTCYFDGTLEITTTDTSISAGTKGGIGNYSGVANGTVDFDDWVIDDEIVASGEPRDRLMGGGVWTHPKRMRSLGT